MRTKIKAKSSGRCSFLSASAKLIFLVSIEQFDVSVVESFASLSRSCYATASLRKSRDIADLRVDAARPWRGSQGFFSYRPSFGVNRPNRMMRGRGALSLPSTGNGGDGTGDDEDWMDDDEALLETVTSSQLQALCEQYNLDTAGDKADMLVRLRGFANRQAEIDRERRRNRVKRIEAGFDERGGGKAKHQILDGATDEYDDDDVDGAFYFQAPEVVNNSSSSTEGNKKSDGAARPNLPRNYPITVPPPKPNAQGERVVTVYSSTDQNDMTGLSSQSMPSQGTNIGMEGGYNRMSGSDPEDSLAAGPFGDQSGSRRKKASKRELDEAKDVVSELVQDLLAMTGAPAFQDEYSEGLLPLSEEEGQQRDIEALQRQRSQFGFIGFDPGRVPSDLLSRASRALRMGNGEALRSVLSEYEIQAIGHDGLAADDVEKGGGHYREVQKVSAFLEGYRKAEDRRVARATATMCLDKLVTEGVKGLDMMLAAMTKGGDGASDVGELNDAFLKYLDEAVREQERKVEQFLANDEAAGRSRSAREVNILEKPESDQTSHLWNVTQDEDGVVVESIDPNDPEVQRVLKKEMEKSSNNGVTGVVGGAMASGVKSVQEQLLLLLTLLRERVKAEAAFANDEKGRNLRLLAYCLHASNDEERRQYIMNELGSCLDALDSFSELLDSSIDYAEAVSSEFQPSRATSLNLGLLRSVKVVVEDIRAKQAFMASGISKQDNNAFR